MRLQNVFLLLFFLFLLVLLFVSSSEKFFSGSVVSVSFSSSRTLIVVDGFDLPLVVFDRLLSVEVGDTISFSGREDSFRGRDQFVVDHLFLIS